MRKRFNMIIEAISISWKALTVNKLRSLLSLLGITIGIWVVITVFAALDSMERTMRDSIQSLGTNVVFVQKWPWSFSDNYPWWKYLNRPVASLSDLEAIEQYSELAETSAFIAGTSRTVEHLNSSMMGASVVVASHNYDQVRSFELLMGRYFTENESRRGDKVTVIGYNVAAALFSGKNPIGQAVSIGGTKARVIGVFEREGESMIGNSTDYDVLVPVNFARSFLDLKSDNLDPKVMVKARDGVELRALQDELTGILRAERRLKPRQDQNFALNEISVITQEFASFFQGLAMIGLFVGGLSLLVGSFAIANIMFVSVKERVSLIGIQKSLGAKKWFILSQFLSEALLLCLVGGAMGLLLAAPSVGLIGLLMDIPAGLSQQNIITGVGISSVIGVLAGFIPAWQAARLNPVDAIRSK